MQLFVMAAAAFAAALALRLRCILVLADGFEPPTG